MFSKNEQRLIDTDYFEIIRVSDYYIEIKSKNTKHMWIIHKHRFEDDNGIYLYHKHSNKDPYYHFHRSQKTVRACLLDIYGHDRFQMNGRWRRMR